MLICENGSKNFFVRMDLLSSARCGIKNNFLHERQSDESMIAGGQIKIIFL